MESYFDTHLTSAAIEAVNGIIQLAKRRERKESARKTLRQISSELHVLVRELFPDGAHPWAVLFSQSIEDHKTEPAVRGEASESICFDPRSNCGIWYEYIGKAPAVGFIGEHDLKALSEILSETGHI